MNDGWRVDSFAALDGLSNKEQRDPEAVLAILRRAKRFSVWDMESRALRNTVRDLQGAGRITTDSTVPYPWVGVTVNDSPTPHQEPQ